MSWLVHEKYFLSCSVIFYIFTSALFSISLLSCFFYVPLCSPQTVWWSMRIHLFCIYFGIYLSLFLSQMHRQDKSYTWIPVCPLAGCHDFSFPLISLIVSSSELNSLPSTGPSRKKKKINKLIIERAEDMICLQGQLIYYLSFALILVHSAPWLWFCRRHFLSELCLITYLLSIPLALSKECTFFFVNEYNSNYWWHVLVCLCRWTVHSTCSVWCMTRHAFVLIHVKAKIA